MRDNYLIRFYKNNTRVAPRMLNGADARFFYNQLKWMVGVYKKRYKKKLNDKSILIVVDNKEIYRKRDKLESASIQTIEDMIEYLGIEFEPEYIFANNVTTNDKSLKLSDIYVLQIYSSWAYLTDAQLGKGANDD